MRRAEYLALSSAIRSTRTLASSEPTEVGEAAFNRALSLAARVMANKLYELHNGFDKAAFLQDSGVNDTPRLFRDSLN